MYKKEEHIIFHSLGYSMREGDNNDFWKPVMFSWLWDIKGNMEFLESYLKDHFQVRAASIAKDEWKLFAFGDALTPSDFSL